MLNTYDNIASDEEVELPIQTHSQLVMNDWAIPDLIHNLQIEIIGRNSELIRGRSDLTFVRTEHLTIKVAQWDLLAGAFHSLSRFPFAQVQVGSHFVPRGGAQGSRDRIRHSTRTDGHLSKRTRQSS